MNSFKTSMGERVPKDEIDRRTKKAKARFLEMFLNEYGYYFCEGEDHDGTCGQLSISHVVSVNEAQNSGRAELCWDTDNFKLLCIKCHQKVDKNCVMSGKVIEE